MISGIHLIIYTKDPEADKVFFRDILKLPNVDAGNGRLFFALPPSELGLHDAAENDTHEIYLICDDIHVFVQNMEKENIACSGILERGWGKLVQITLPGGGKLGIYQPNHARP